ncbi:hypothetical protein BO99DRAFT_238393 [Aspergillus violaceofuscus CBS 115571]|uniref:NB-ARC domain-containing protein n=1 Tax=Aspergillus violaceofuscus (strain CBS 115571) TaxID=1450538 RepID=A0A2V5GWT9_ASPV1|nr:hypothetical protein BO99DRAFT_238393 [Aspergillus violaceofuscus CBS 115571]
MRILDPDTYHILCSDQSTAKNGQFPEVFPFNTSGFVAREKLQSQIEGELNIIGAPRICALQGLGGIGKTTMARKVALAFKDKCHIFWIDCRMRTKMDEDFLAIGPALQPGADSYDFHRIKQAMASREDWMLIIDNVDNDETLAHVQENMIRLVDKDAFCSQEGSPHLEMSRMRHHANSH